MDEVNGISNLFTGFIESRTRKPDKKSWNRFQKPAIYLLKRFREKQATDDATGCCRRLILMCC